MHRFEEHVVLSSPQDNLEVRHLRLWGTNEAIGRKLGEIARSRHQVARVPGEDKLLVRSQRHYLERNYPILIERMKGTARAYDLNLEDDQVDFSYLGWPVLGNSCTAVYYPPATTEAGHGLISRNLDFYMPTVMPALARPYIVEMYPNKGYPSLSLLSFELLGEALEGINSEGLTVCHLADDESMEIAPMEPTYGNSVGLNELKSTQMLLDTCANVDEAKQALLLNKHFYMFQPVHLLVADRFGNAFVWEYSHAHNKEHFIDSKPDSPLIVSNFLLHRHQSAAAQELPYHRRDKTCPYNRYRAIEAIIGGHSHQKVTPEFARQTNAAAFMERGSSAKEEEAHFRTLVHSLYDIDNRSMEISFFLRDGAEGETGGQGIDEARVTKPTTESIRSPYYLVPLTLTAIGCNGNNKDNGNE